MSNCSDSTAWRSPATGFMLDLASRLCRFMSVQKKCPLDWNTKCCNIGTNYPVSKWRSIKIRVRDGVLNDKLRADAFHFIVTQWLLLYLKKGKKTAWLNFFKNCLGLSQHFFETFVPHVEKWCVKKCQHVMSWSSLSQVTLSLQLVHYTLHTLWVLLLFEACNCNNKTGWFPNRSQPVSPCGSEL